MKYLLKWTNDRPAEAFRDRFNSREEAEAYVRSYFAGAEFLALAAKAGALPGESLYAWQDLATLEAGKPHLAVLRPIALGSTVQIDAAFIPKKE
jgi:hypothetical protein